VTYEEAEPFTTKVKHMDFSRAVRDLKHNPKITPERGHQADGPVDEGLLSRRELKRDAGDFFKTVRAVKFLMCLSRK